MGTGAQGGARKSIGNRVPALRRRVSVATRTRRGRFRRGVGAGWGLRERRELCNVQAWDRAAGSTPRNIGMTAGVGGAEPRWTRTNPNEWSGGTCGNG